MRRREAFGALAVSVGAFALLSLWPHAMLHPVVWEPISAAAGLRPQADPFHGVTRGLLTVLTMAAGGAGMDMAVRLAARVIGSASAAVVYLVLCDICAAVLRPEPHLFRLFRPAGRIVAGVGALAFLCLDPVWRAAQALSTTTVFLLMLALAGWMFAAFARNRRLPALYLSVALLGVLSGEYAIGIPLSVVATLGIMRFAAANPLDPLSDRFVWSVHSHGLILAWLFGCAASVSLGVWMFLRSGGVVPVVCGDGLDMLVSWLRGAWAQISGAADASGWMFGLFGCIAPFVAAAMMLESSRRDDAYLPFVVGVAYVVVGAVSFAQLTGANSVIPGMGARQAEIVPSETLRAFFLLFALFALTLTLMVFGANAVCRNYRSIAHWRFPDSMEMSVPAKLAAWLGRNRKWRVRIVMAALGVVALSAVLSRRMPLEREMMSLMDAYADEVLREMDERETVFTDGSFDMLLELKAWALGRRVRAVSMMAPGTEYERAVRVRAAENEEDLSLFGVDAAAALRTWVESDSPRLERCAVQLGLEYWKRGSGDLPPLSGVVALPGENSADALQDGRDAGDALAAEALALCRLRNPSGTHDRELRRLYPFVLWRLSRFMRMRSQVDAAARRYSASVREAQTSEELDGFNYELEAMHLGSRWLRRNKKGVLTPREGLAIGLARADFTFAADYAAKVLDADPDDSRANFAAGMKHLLSEDYVLAERHLLRCLINNPDEPAALNNLANAELKLGKVAEAEDHAMKALSKLPNNTVIKRTLERIRQVASAAK